MFLGLECLCNNLFTNTKLQIAIDLERIKDTLTQSTVYGCFLHFQAIGRKYDFFYLLFHNRFVSPIHSAFYHNATNRFNILLIPSPFSGGRV